jgi:hypothetical protein
MAKVLQQVAAPRVSASATKPVPGLRARYLATLVANPLLPPQGQGLPPQPVLVTALRGPVPSPARQPSPTAGPVTSPVGQIPSSTGAPVPVSTPFPVRVPMPSLPPSFQGLPVGAPAVTSLMGPLPTMPVFRQYQPAVQIQSAECIPVAAMPCAPQQGLVEAPPATGPQPSTGACGCCLPVVGMVATVATTSQTAITAITALAGL